MWLAPILNSPIYHGLMHAINIVAITVFIISDLGSLRRDMNLKKADIIIAIITTSIFLIDCTLHFLVFGWKVIRKEYWG